MSTMSDEAQFICDKCRQIDFESVIQLDAATLQAPKNSHGILIAQLGARDDVRFTNGCQLCLLLHVTAAAAAAAVPLSDRGSDNWELRAFSFLKCSTKTQVFFCPKAIRQRDQPTLAVVPSGIDRDDIPFHLEKYGHILCCSKKGGLPLPFSPCIVPRSLDYHTIGKWIGFCKTNHKRLCGSKGSLPSGLRLINCYSTAIEAAPPSCSYAALSYVWGNSRTTCANITLREHLSVENLPKVVSDAIVVTMGLGIQYLWIDKYCINQDDPSDKHTQIGQMDTIYRKADITIVAAAAVDESFGLSGVASTPRNVQPVAALGDITVIATMAHPHVSIEASKWWTRGWTYQEAVLSRRRLVFTKDQTYFECNAMNCYESLPGDLDLLHVKTKYKLQRFLHSGILSGRGERCFGPMDMENLSQVASWDRFTILIEDYTKRDLTYAEDSLRAFNGIMRDVAISKYPVAQIWGVPFLMTNKEAQYKYLALGLLWKHKYCSSRPDRPYRQSGFPSWSWAGWKGSVEFTKVPFHDFKSHLEAVYLEVEHGVLVEHFYLTRNLAGDDLSFSYPLALHLDVWVVPPEEITLNAGHNNVITGSIVGLKAEISLSQRPGGLESLKSLLRTRKWEVAILAVIRTEGYPPPPQSLFLMVEHTMGSSSRVGTITVPLLEFSELQQVPELERRRIRLI